MIKKVKKGDSISANQWNELVDLVNANLTNSPQATFNTTDFGEIDARTAIEPNFIKDGDSWYVSIIGSYILKNGENVIPKFKDSTIGISGSSGGAEGGGEGDGESSDNALIDIEDPTREACYKALSNGSYEIKLSYDGGSSAFVDCDLVGSATGEYKLYTFDVTANGIENFVDFMETGLFVSSGNNTKPLDVLLSPQAYHGEVPDTELGDDEIRVWIRYGSIEGVIANNWKDSLTVVGGSEKVYIYAEVTLDQGDILSVTSWEIKQQTADVKKIEASDYTEAQMRPSKIKIVLGTLVGDADEDSDGYTLVNEGGSVQLLEYVVQTTSTTGKIGYKRSIYAER